jgi:hypothetical protein
MEMAYESVVVHLFGFIVNGETFREGLSQILGILLYIINYYQAH